MKRRRIKKIRTTICIDEDIFMESGDYIYNLSAFVQECMKREIEKQKAKEEKQLRITTIMSRRLTPEEEEEIKKVQENASYDWINSWNHNLGAHLNYSLLIT